MNHNKEMISYYNFSTFNCKKIVLLLQRCCKTASKDVLCFLCASLWDVSFKKGELIRPLSKFSSSGARDYAPAALLRESEAGLREIPCNLRSPGKLDGKTTIEDVLRVVLHWAPHISAA